MGRAKSLVKKDRAAAAKEVKRYACDAGTGSSSSSESVSPSGMTYCLTVLTFLLVVVIISSAFRHVVGVRGIESDMDGRDFVCFLETDGGDPLFFGVGKEFSEMLEGGGGDRVGDGGDVCFVAGDGCLR